MQVVASHSCTSDTRGSTQGAKFQDAKYGPGKRVFTTKGNNEKGTCTVCGQK